MNKAILMGRLTADPALKSTNNGISVCTFSIAVDRRFKNASGERETDFISCVAWRQTAEFVAKYFNKGSMIAVVGSLQTRNYEGSDGNKVYITEIVVDETFFTGEKKESASRQDAAGQRTPMIAQRREGPTQGNFGGPDDDTELPFDL